MKLDTTALRYLTNEDWRVLTAVEIGSRNHEVVPTPLIIQLSHLRSGSGVHKSISTLAKANLIARTKNAKYDGYRLTYGGLDYLALHTHLKSSTLYSTGPIIGCGKESDIYACTPPPTPLHPHPRQLVLKIHRLGRISFRTIKQNRDYLTSRRTSASWMYMSRLSAQKEFAFLKALGEEGFPVPGVLGWSRHTVIMEMVEGGWPLRSVRRLGGYFGGDGGGGKGVDEDGQKREDGEEDGDESAEDKKSDPAAVGALYATLLSLIVRLAKHGLIHGDFNEFNILLSTPSPDDDPTQPKVTLIDFPQTLSTSHPNAEFYFDRDVACVKTFFRRRFGFTSEEPGPFLPDVMASAVKDGGSAKRLDVQVEASGFSRKMAKELEKYMKEIGADGDRDRAHAAQNDESEDGMEDGDEEDDDAGEGQIEDIDKRDGGRHKMSTKNGAKEEDPNGSLQAPNTLSIQDGS